MNIMDQIKIIAREYDLELTENAPKIARAREMMNCPLTMCICDREDKKRYCISDKCMAEIKEKGVCHCNCYKRK